MKKLLFIAIALTLVCGCAHTKTDAWQTLCNLDSEEPASSIYVVSNTGEEDFVQCRIQSYSDNGGWQTISTWPECEELDAGETISKDMEAKLYKTRLQIGVHEDIHGWCTIIQKR
jgi:hypothetical protein